MEKLRYAITKTPLKVEQKGNKLVASTTIDFEDYRSEYHLNVIQMIRDIFNKDGYTAKEDSLQIIPTKAGDVMIFFEALK